MSKGIFGEWLDQFMKKHGIKAAQIADLTRFHHNVVRNWVRGRSLPNGCSFILLIDALQELTGLNWNAVMQEAAKPLRRENK